MVGCGLSVEAHREGAYVVLQAYVQEGEIHDVEVSTQRGLEKLESVGGNKWQVMTPYGHGVFKAVVCTDKSCTPVKIDWKVPGQLFDFSGIIGLAVLAGVIMNFLPCVLPVLGLKLLAASKGGGKLPYVVGVLFSFVILATLAVLLGSGLSHMSLPLFRAVLVLTCMMMGTHFLGLWHMPGFALPRWASGTGAFGLGITTVALGSSCSVPFLAPVLVYTSNHVWWETYLLFLAMGVGFASPFILPVYKLFPKPGAWMLWLEKVSGAVLLLVAAWLACTLSGGPLMAVAWLAFWLLVILVANGSTHDKLACILLALISCWAIVDVYGRTLMPPASVEIPVDKQPGIILVTADWCLNCPIAHHIIESDEVKEAVAEMQGVLIVLDWTNSDPAIGEFMRGYGVEAVPFALIISTDGRETVLSGIFTKQQVLDALR
jgi:thiol:disulfide interchange protein